jgi:hypothetical protein
VSSGCGSKPGRRGGAGHPGDHFFDRLATLNRTAAVIENSVRCERRDIEIGIVKIEREEITRLQVLNRGAILRIAADGTSLGKQANRIGHQERHEPCDERCRAANAKGTFMFRILTSLSNTIGKNDRRPVSKI